MITLILTHEVKNFSDWKPFFDSDEPTRTGAGFKLSGLYQGLDNPNKVTIIFEVPGIEVVNGFLSNPNLKETMEKAGVISEPSILLLHKV